MTTSRLMEITPETLRKYRESKGLSLTDFWGAMGYTMSRGHAYETGRTAIPEHAIRLFTLHYLAGVPTDVKAPEFKIFLRQFTESDVRILLSGSQKIENAIELLHNAMDELKVLKK